MRHIAATERLTSPVTDEERAAYAAYQGTTLSSMALTTYVIRRREAAGDRNR